MSGVVFSTVVSGLLVAVGVIGTIIPVLPGMVVVVAGFVLYAFLTGWDPWAVAIVVGAGGIAAIAAILGVRIPARETGAVASRRSLWMGGLLGVVGFFTIPVVGLPLGWVAGVFLSEANGSNTSEAWSATMVALRSFGKAALLQFSAALLLAVVWGTWAVTELF